MDDPNVRDGLDASRFPQAHIATEACHAMGIYAAQVGRDRLAIDDLRRHGLKLTSLGLISALPDCADFLQRRRKCNAPAGDLQALEPRAGARHQRNVAWRNHYRPGKQPHQRLVRLAVAGGGAHPRLLVEQGRGDEFVDRMSAALERFAAAFADHHGDVALFAAADVGVDPLHELRIGPHRCSQQRALVRVVFVPVVARQMLVVPRKFTGVGI